FALTGRALDVTVVVVTLALASLSFQYVEEPVRRMWSGPTGRRAKAVPRPSSVPMTARFGTGALVVFALIWVSTSGGTPAPIYMQVSDAEAAAGALDESSGFDDTATGAPVNPITTTQAASPTTTA